MKKHGRRPGKENKPLQDAPDSSGKWFARALIPAAVLSAGILAGYRLFVRPELIRFSQKPVFFSDGYFLGERLRIPGGFLDYVAAYLTDLYRIEWLGAAILAGLALLTALLLYVLFRPGRWWFAPILPALLLVSLQARYDFSVVHTLSLILALEGFILYRDALPRKPGTRFVSALALLVPIYLLSPGAMLLWAALCILYELLNPAGSARMRILLSLGYVSAGFVLPGLAAAGFYLVPVREAYFHHALFLHAGKIYAPGAVLAGLILIFAAGFFLLREKDGEKTIRGRIDLIQGVSVLMSVFLVAAAGLRIREERNMLTIRHAAHQGAWKNVVSRIDARTVQDPLCLFHINRALFHTGTMGSRFFTIPQHFGHYGLFLHKDLGYQYPLDLSDFFFELGHINEAGRWASEALTLYGETAVVLKRLALVNIIQDEFPAAHRYLSRLRRNPNSRKWADHYLACLADPSRLRGETALQKLHALMPRENFIVMSDHPEIDLGNLLRQAPANRMAFSYLIMDFLVRRDLDGFLELLKKHGQAAGSQMPRHYEEALIAYLSLKKENADPAASRMDIRKSTIDRFREFERVLARHGGNRDAAYADLSRSHADTYWFYMMYARTSP